MQDVLFCTSVPFCHFCHIGRRDDELVDWFIVDFLYFWPVPCYILNMKKSSLLLSNPYLKDPALRDALLRQTVISSSAIEGVNKTIACQALGVFSEVAATTFSSWRTADASHHHRDL